MSWYMSSLGGTWYAWPESMDFQSAANSGWLFMWTGEQWKRANAAGTQTLA